MHYTSKKLCSMYLKNNTDEEEKERYTHKDKPIHTSWGEMIKPDKTYIKDRHSSAQSQANTDNKKHAQTHTFLFLFCNAPKPTLASNTTTQSIT